MNRNLNHNKTSHKKRVENTNGIIRRRKSKDRQYEKNKIYKTPQRKLKSELHEPHKHRVGYVRTSFYTNGTRRIFYNLHYDIYVRFIAGPGSSSG